MTHDEAERRVLDTVAAYVEESEDWDGFLQRMTQAGYTTLEARKLHALVESAFGWALARRMGVSNFPSELRFRCPAGDFSIPVSDLHEFLAAAGLAIQALDTGYSGRLKREGFETLALESAEVDAVNKALNAGDDVSGASITTVIDGFAYSDFYGQQKKPWWRFW